MDQERADRSQWIAAIVALAKAKGVIITEAELAHQSGWVDGEKFQNPVEALQTAAERCGLKLELVETSLARVPSMLLPAIFEVGEGRVVIAEERTADGVRVSVPGIDKAEPKTIAEDDFAAAATGRVLFVELLSTRKRDARVEEFLQTPTKHWFRDIILKDKRGYRDVVLASIFGNLLSFSTALFAMQIWDRVIPANSIPTLWVLGIGVCIALLLEFVLRTARVVVLDRMGKEADLAISSRVFARALDIRNDERPKSTGSFIGQIRDIEQLRELLASTSIAALVDLPFVLLFLGLFAMLAGQLTVVLVVALIFIALPGMLVQIPLARIARQGMQESALRQAILVESIERIEEIKSAQAEARFQSQWEKLTYTGARISAAQRFYAALFTNWTQTLQHLAYTAVLITGSFMVMDGEMSMGALIACSILTSRALVLFMPFGQIFTRWQSAKLSMEALKGLMGKSVDHDPEAGHLRRSTLRGHYEISDMAYAYEMLGPVSLKVATLEIRPGERVALLGQIGAGKTTLLRLLAGMTRPVQGKLMLDGTIMGTISPADIRREVAYLGQNAQLFLGTVRDNLLVGAPHASDEDILQALSVSGGLPLVQSQSQGLDLMLQEGGVGLSGGQRQTLLLARTLLRNSNVLLLDEPSASLDEQSERRLVQQLGQWLGHRTLVVTTNRSGLLPLVNRIVVIDRGQVVMDGPRDQVIAKLQGAGGPQASAQPSSQAAAQPSPSASAHAQGQAADASNQPQRTPIPIPVAMQGRGGKQTVHVASVATVTKAADAANTAANSNANSAPNAAPSDNSGTEKLS